MRADLNRQIRTTSNSVGNNARILQQREGEIRAALAAQKSKVLALNTARDEIAVLNKEVENAQLVYQAAYPALFADSAGRTVQPVRRGSAQP